MSHPASGAAVPMIAFMAALTVHGAFLWAWTFERPLVVTSPAPVWGVTLVTLPASPSGAALPEPRPSPVAPAPPPARPHDNGLDQRQNQLSAPRQSHRPEATEPRRAAPPTAAALPAKPPRRTSHHRITNPVVAEPAAANRQPEDQPRAGQRVMGHAVPPAAVPAAPSAAVASPAVSEALASTVRTEVFERLRQAVARHKRYPLKSRRRGEQGRVTVRLTLNPSGAISAVALAVSSGHRRLDNAALRAVRQASPLAGLDDRLTRPVRLSLPVVFRFN